MRMSRSSTIRSLTLTADSETAVRLMDPEAWSPLSAEDIKSIQVLDKQWSKRLWVTTDHEVASGRTDDSTPIHIYNKDILISPRPRNFLRRVDEISHSEYPYRTIEDLELEVLRNTIDDIGIPLHAQATIQSAFRLHRSRSVGLWLEMLPVNGLDIVLVSREPSETLLMTWDFFATHWESFYDRFARLNISGINKGWFLFFHAEAFAIWGASEQYLAAMGVSDRVAPWIAKFSIRHYFTTARSNLTKALYDVYNRARIDQEV